jgi:hypothetical protein
MAATVGCYRDGESHYPNEPQSEQAAGSAFFQNAGNLEA